MSDSKGYVDTIDQRYYYDTESGKFATAVQTYDASGFEGTANGGDGTTFSASAIKAQPYVALYRKVVYSDLTEAEKNALEASGAARYTYDANEENGERGNGTNDPITMKGAFKALKESDEGWEGEFYVLEYVKASGYEDGIQTAVQQNRANRYYTPNSGNYYIDTIDQRYYYNADTGSYASSEPVVLKDAIVNNGSVVNADKDINIISQDALNALMISGTVAVGGTAGVGVGVSVAVLNSNVVALADEGSELNAGGDIKVEATSGSAEVDTEAALAKLPGREDSALTADMISRNNRKADKADSGATETEDEESGETASTETKKSTIRMISVTAGGGYVGVGVSAAVMTVFSDVAAKVAGKVTKAQNVDVHSAMDYGTVQTINVGVAAGFVAVNVSAGVSYFGGSANATVTNTASLSKISESIKVRTTGTTDATAVAATLGGGAVAVNAGVALAINRTMARSAVEQGAKIDAEKAALDVSHNIHAQGRALTLSVTLGGVAVGASAAIVVNKLDAASYVGLAAADTGSASEDSETEAYDIKAKSLHIDAQAAGDVLVAGAGAAGGGVAVNAIVALGLNFAKNIGSVSGMRVKLSDDMTTTATLDSETKVATTAITVGGVAVGASIDVAYIGSHNEAAVDTTRGIEAGRLMINAGTADKPNDSLATVLGITGSAGAVAANINLGLALNSGVNRAALTGNGGSLTLTGVTPTEPARPDARRRPCRPGLRLRPVQHGALQRGSGRCCRQCLTGVQLAEEHAGSRRRHGRRYQRCQKDNGRDLRRRADGRRISTDARRGEDIHLQIFI